MIQVAHLALVKELVVDLRLLAPLAPPERHPPALQGLVPCIVEQCLKSNHPHDQILQAHPHVLESFPYQSGESENSPPLSIIWAH